MSKRGKLRQKLRNNPKNATKQDVETLLLSYGFVLDRVSVGVITSMSIKSLMSHTVW
jgi:hypothetical protein